MALGYLLCGLYVMRPVLHTPNSAVLGPAHDSQLYQLSKLDQKMVLSTVVGNARRLFRSPTSIRDEGQCHPLPHSYTLGEHMFGNSLMAAIPLAISDAPVLSYNIVVFLTLWVPAMAMYAFARELTGSAIAAFVAGILFGFASSSIRDPTHPYVHGDLWLPLILLCLHRVIARPSWGSGLALGVSGGLQLLESFYSVISAALIVSAYSIFLVYRFRHRARTFVPQLVIASGMVLAVGALVFGPYLESRSQWSGTTRASLFAFQASFGPGQTFFPGCVPLLLTGIALLDRMRGRHLRVPHDERIILAVAGFWVFWCSVFALRLPFGVAIPSPLLLLQSIVPGLDSVRALANIGLGVFFATAALASYGVVVFANGLSRWAGVALGILLSLLAMAEVTMPSWSSWSFGKPLRQEPTELDISRDVQALLERIPPGAVLDVPVLPRNLVANTDYLQLAAYHGEPVAACYNSRASEVPVAVASIARQLPSRPAVDALHALGFRTLLLHQHLIRNTAIAKECARGGQLKMIGRADGIWACALRATSRSSADWSILEHPGRSTKQAGTPSALVVPAAGDIAIAFHIENTTRATFVHPAPISPSDLALRWRNGDGQIVLESRTRRVLPLAMGPGVAVTVDVQTSAPDLPGTYSVELVRVGSREISLGTELVRVH